MNDKYRWLQWLHASPRRCVYCGEVGARVIVLGGFAHRRCVNDRTPKKKTTKRKEGPDGR